MHKQTFALVAALGPTKIVEVKEKVAFDAAHAAPVAWS